VSDDGSVYWIIDGPVAFSCRGVIASDDTETEADTEWRISICQLGEDLDELTISGGLVSKFRNFTNFMSVADNDSTVN
jgi:hypothetical protein